MDTLLTIFPDPDVLLDLPPEELAAAVLKLATADRQQSGVFRPDTVYQHDVTDHAEAQEIVMLASQLMRMVDYRRK